MKYIIQDEFGFYLKCAKRKIWSTTKNARDAFMFSTLKAAEGSKNKHCRYGKIVECDED